MPSEPTIAHRVVVWGSVYDNAYLPDSFWWGTAPSLSRDRWMQLKKTALKELSVKYYGDLASCNMKDPRLTAAQRELKRQTGGFNEPVCLMSLVERAKHSNFAACDKCAKARALWMDYRARRARGEEGDLRAVGDIKRKIFEHLSVFKRERQFAQELLQLCAKRSGLSYEYDDKCGIQHLYLPAPLGGRHTAATAGAQCSLARVE
eukprot:6191703-Pleurochrysis_carterae.AAC.1